MLISPLLHLQKGETLQKLNFGNCARIIMWSLETAANKPLVAQFHSDPAENEMSEVELLTDFADFDRFLWMKLVPT